jgi:6-hydroxycyclohex-1-ene-1-carbonyl-CoA dehydrogenase
MHQAPTGHRWLMYEPKSPLERVAVDAFEAGPGEVVVEVAGCGVCHTDVGFHAGDVRTRAELPLALGHEISGRVVAAGEGAEHLFEQAVIVPAVLPCGKCGRCRGGLANACTHQFMPGNDGHGGFASHVVVPARGLCTVPTSGPGVDPHVADTDLKLSELSVLADAITTPYQAIVRSGLKAGDVAIVVGLGGVGGFCAQIASALGARVLGLDPNPDRRDALVDACALGTLDPTILDGKALRAEIRSRVKTADAPDFGWQILECSGTPAGQETAFGLVGYGATLSVIGFTPERLSLRLSNLMAFHARAIGTWGCLPERYPDALALVLDGRVRVRPFVERVPMSESGRVLESLHAASPARRPVLVPDAAL